MAKSSNFSTNKTQCWPDPAFNKLIEDDPQIVRVPLESLEIGSRPSQMKRIDSRNSMKIDHEPSKG